MMFLPQFPGELEHVDALVVLHAGERFRAESFLGEEIEPGPAHPVVNERIAARVSSKTRLHPFFENFIQLRLQRVDVRDAGSAGRRPFRLLLPKLQKIEIKSAI